MIFTACHIIRVSNEGESCDVCLVAHLTVVNEHKIFGKQKI